MTQQTKIKKSAQTVQDALDRFNIECTVIELPSSTRTAIDAANSIGCEVAHIIKSLIFKTASEKPILILASGINQVNVSLIESAIGEKTLKADANFAREVTGFAIGGIPPIGHVQRITTLIDEDLINHAELWAAAGTPNAVFNLNPSDLLKITEGLVIAIK